LKLEALFCVQADEERVGGKLVCLLVVDNAVRARIALDASKARGFCIGGSARVQNNNDQGLLEALGMPPSG
jgi:hypothetical protein